MNLTKIKQVHETKNIKEVNDLLKRDWVLLEMCRNDGVIYVLGKVNPESPKAKNGFNDETNIEARKKREAELKELKRQILSSQKKMVKLANGVFVEIV